MPSVGVKLYSVFFKLLLRHRMLNTGAANTTNDGYGTISRANAAGIPANASFVDGVATKDVNIDPFTSLSLRIFLPQTVLPKDQIRQPTAPIDGFLNSYSAVSALVFKVSFPTPGKLSNGEVISCLPMYEQPSLNSLDHASNAYLKEPATEEQTQVISDETEFRPAEQLFMSEVGRCPTGMIPVLRNQLSLRRTRGSSREGVDSIHGNYGHKLTYATYYRKWPPSSLFIGAKGYFNVWNASVEDSSEFSLSQMWITAGSYDENNLNTIEVGWQVYERLYGNKYPHLFIYWTSDAYTSTGCYNLECRGFVQTSHKWVLGGSFSTISQTNGQQYELQVLIITDRGKGVWWLMVNGEYIGYWPGTLFTTLRSGATNVQWGGEILNSAAERHTRTHMGSGEFAEAGYQRAAYIRKLQTVSSKFEFVDAPLLQATPSATKVNCYSVKLLPNISSTWGTHMYFGGPGYDIDYCPI
ncbi:hypothetical protein R1sor_026456 [Riccia sorocarpa]|uniref:Neprosin PEP catalytic domain-containing protein n=1 Tax=Riccia sorocarpa TaxID=122646 RepID=A0ABD3GC34_9MARC